MYMCAHFWYIIFNILTCSNCALKMSVSKLISYVFYCFTNFLCISLFFQPFVFNCFFTEICCSHFFMHYLAKINSIQSLKVKITSSILFFKSQFALDLYTKYFFLAISHETVRQDPCVLRIYRKKRARVSELKSISSKLFIWILRTAGETPLGVGLVLNTGATDDVNI